MSNRINQDAIKSIESAGSGGYTARGPLVTSGMYRGQRALGAYQVMPGNLPQWSRQALGREVTEDEFMESEDIQDAIFDDQWRRNTERYGSDQDAVSVWFTGRPLEEGGNRSDGYITGNEYVNRYNRYVQNPHRTTDVPPRRGSTDGDHVPPIDVSPSAEEGEGSARPPVILSDLVNQSMEQARTKRVIQPTPVRTMGPISFMRPKPNPRRSSK